MSTPPNGYLGQEALFQKGDRVYYSATPYWEASRGMWHDIEGVQGTVQGVEKSIHVWRARDAVDRQHPFKYPILFDGHIKSLTPAPENVQFVSGSRKTWEL